MHGESTNNAAATTIADGGEERNSVLIKMGVWSLRSDVQVTADLSDIDRPDPTSI